MEKPTNCSHGEKRKHEGDEHEVFWIEEPSWVQSKCSEHDLQVLVRECRLQLKDTIQWRSAVGEFSPSTRDSEIVLFTAFVKHGLAVPASDFLQVLLYHYGIQIHHLTLESVLHIAVLVHFCEAFLGIEPHFKLFRSLYNLVPLPSSKKIGSIGCANLQLCSEMIDKYIEWPRIHVDPD